jgi:hypothetical protein
MTSPIDPIRRGARLRRSGKTAAERAEAASGAEGSNLPVPVGPVRTIPPVAEIAGGGAEFDAQLLGQDGQKRGLRAGPSVIDTASATYNRIEWSGSKDRRARKGRIARTDV